jgi:quinoprotein glucose dehydrogenase
MKEDDANRDKPRYVWPRYILAAVILGIVLFVIWVGVAAKRVHDMRQSNPWAAPPVPGSETPAAKTNASSANDLLAGFRDALSGGDAAAGRGIFFDRPEANCAKCHKLGGQGGDTGPALDGVDSRRTREEILEAILYPNLHVVTNYETVIVLLKNGTGLSGMLKSEDATNLLVNTPDEGLVTVKKDEIQTRQRGVSPMPEGLGQILPKTDLRDLVEFVAASKTQ